MKTGLFCNYENHQQDDRRAIFEQVALVRQAEKLGFDEAWVSEHHFNAGNISSSMLVLIAHLAGVTTTIKLGTAAVLLPFHNPIRVAEDIATLDNLCNGRLLFGVAKGGPFPKHNQHFAIPLGESRARMLEAMALIQKLLYENDGDVVTCRDKIKQFQDKLNLGTLALKPASLNLNQNQESLLRYNQEVRNYV